jgi:hypothetical protein
MTESRTVHYWKEATKYHESAKFARPAYLGDFYRRVAMRYLFMAEDVSRWPERCVVYRPKGGGAAAGIEKRPAMRRVESWEIVRWL